MGSLTLAEHIRNLSQLKSLPTPGQIVGSGVPATRQLLQFAQMAGAHLLVFRFPWMRETKTFTTTTASNLLGRWDTLSGGKAWAPVPRTFYNRSAKLPLHGPLTPEELAQAQVYGGSMTPWPAVAFDGLELSIYPAVPIGTVISWHQTTTAWIESSTGARLTHFAGDTDKVLFDDTLFEQALALIWAREKGMPFDKQEANVAALAKQFSAAAGMRAGELALDTTYRSNTRVSGIFNLRPAP